MDYVISRANSCIHHDEEVYMLVDPLITTTLTKAKNEVVQEREEITDTLNSVIGDALIKAGTGV